MPHCPFSRRRYGAAVAAAAAVVHVHHGEAARGPELHLRIEHRVGGGGRTAVAQHQQRRRSAGRRAEARVGRRVVKGVHGLAAAVEGDRLGRRHERRVERVGARSLEHFYLGSAERHAGDGRTLGGGSADEVRRTAVGHDRVERLEREREGFDPARFERQQRQVPAPLLRVGHHELTFRREGVGGRAQDPLRPPELRRQRVQGLDDVAAMAIQVPPAGAVRHEVEDPVGRPRRLEHRLVGATRHPDGLARHAGGVELGDEELGAVPGHVRVPPLQPGEPAPVGAEAGVGIEVGALRQHDARRRPLCVQRDGSDGRRRLRIALGVVLADADEPPARLVHPALGEEIAVGREGTPRTAGRDL